MPRYDTDDLEERINRGLVVQEAHPDDVDLLDYLAHRSRADPTKVER